jgi:hypothetical protein
MAYPPFHPSSAAPVPLFMSEAEFGRAFPSESDYVERKSGFNRTALQEARAASGRPLIASTVRSGS